MRSLKTNGGMTLIEVVVSLALMGTLLTVILIGGSQHLRQLRSAERKRVSVRKLDEFMTAWSLDQFSVSAIPLAVERSGLSVRGHFGEHKGTTSVPRYRVDVTRVRRAEIGSGSVVRLSVSVTEANGETFPTCWAEVMVDS